MSDLPPKPDNHSSPGWLDEVIIRELGPEDSFEALTELLHRAYRALADQGLKYLATHQDVATTIQRVGQGTAFVADYRGDLVGTITYRTPENTRIPQKIPIASAGSLGQLAVEPQYQGSGLGRRLFMHAEQFARAQGIKALALDTAEPATHLIAWYERMGYQFVEHVQWDITNYRSVVLVKFFD
ncbi:MAG: GNAT family N-acetyltransferase [candidate division Zixibacteria bacterium]|nr:GNAT family N-acetyltransferase [candidate division Zixibacteria bacterium]